MPFVNGIHKASICYRASGGIRCYMEKFEVLLLSEECV